MLLDVLCPGSWQDSYESRILGEGSYHIEVRCFHDVLRTLKEYFSSSAGIADQELFSDFDLYLDFELFGTYRKGEVIIFPPTCDFKVSDGKASYRYKFGRTGYIVSLEALELGLNSRTVRIDDTHVW